MSCKSNFSEEQYVDLIVDIINNYKNKIIESKEILDKIVKSRPQLNDLTQNLKNRYEHSDVNNLLTKHNIDKKYIDQIDSIITNKEQTNKQIDNLLSELNLSQKNKDLLDTILSNSQKEKINNS